jgi:signal peptidase II
MTQKKRMIMLAVVLVGSVGLDQWSKTWADYNLGNYFHPVPVVIDDSEDGKTLKEVLQARFGFDDADIDRLFDRKNLLVQQVGSKVSPDDKAFTLDGKPVAFYWAFHHLDTSVPPRRVPIIRKGSENIHADYAGKSIAELMEVALPYLSDERRAAVLKDYLYAERQAHLLVPDKMRVKKGQMYVLREKRVTVIDGFMVLKYAENPGAAWGFLSSQSESFRKWFFLLISLLAITAISIMLHRLDSDQGLPAVAFAVILSGAVGNFIDRLRFNYVIDFIDMYIGDSHWPTYNVADIAITVGVGLLLVDLLVNKKRSFLRTAGQKEEPKEEPKRADA